MTEGRVVFIGMEDGGYRALETLLAMGVKPMVFTVTEEMKDKIIAYREFDGLAQEWGLELHKTKDINAPWCVERIGELRPDVIYVVYWSQLVCDEILKLPKVGTVGFHLALLPKHRGRAPIPWSIIHGLRRSGVTMFWITPGTDNGEIIGQLEYAITEDDDAGTVYNKAVEAAVCLLVRYHEKVLAGIAPRLKQDERRASYWVKRTPPDGIIDWNMDARHAHDWVRALTHPFPGAFTWYSTVSRGDRKLWIWKTRLLGVLGEKFTAGTVLDILHDGVMVRAGKGTLVITAGQWEGEDELVGASWAEKCGLECGDRLG